MQVKAITDLVEDEEEHLNGKDHEEDGGEYGGQMEDQLARGGRQSQQPWARHLRRNSQTSF
jgi:hypothetical protein